MRRFLHVTALYFVLVLAQLYPVSSAQGAPGEFLYTLNTRGVRQAVPDAAGVAVDKKDNLYVTTTDSVKVYDSSGNLIKTWGSYGSGDGQFSHPNDITVDGSGKVYVADTGNSRVQIFDSSGGFLYKWEDPAPRSIASDGESVYVLGGGTIRLYDKHGTFLTEFGRCDGCWNAPSDLTLTDEGLLYVFYYGEQIKIRVYSGTEMINSMSLSGRFGAITADSQGRIYIAGMLASSEPDCSFLRIYNSKLQQIGGVFEGQDYMPVGHIAVDSKGIIFVAGGPLRLLDSTGAAINRVGAITTDANGNVYVFEGNSRIEVFDSEGQLLHQWTGNFCRPSDAVVDGTGNLHVVQAPYAPPDPDPVPPLCQLRTAGVQVFDAAGNLIRSWGPSSGFGMAIDRNGNFLVSDGYLGIYDKNGNYIGYLTAGEFYGPGLGGIAVDETGDIFFPNPYEHTVYVFDRAYNLVRKLDIGSGDIAVDGTGHLFTCGGTIGIYDKSGNLLQKWDSNSGLRIDAQGVAVDRWGRVYVQGDDQVQLYDGFHDPWYSLSGTVHNASDTGPPILGATVAIAGNTATTSSTGAFSINRITAGTYTLTISRSGYITKTITGYEVKDNISGLDFSLTPVTYSLSGTVRHGSALGAALAGATVSIAGRSAITDSSGAFSITNIPIGTYTLTISKTGYFTRTVPGRIINGNTSGAVFYLSPSYTMSGTVRQGGRTGPVVAGATVTIAGKTATTGSSGTFSITGIPAGSYTLAISKTGYIGKTVTGYIVDGNKSDLEFFLTAACSMSGTVRQWSVKGPLLAGATVAIAGKSAVSDSSGAFSITGIPAGTHTLTVSRPGYLTKTATGVVVSSSKSGLVFFLSPSYTISGTVRIGSATGPGLAGAKVAIAGRSAITGSTGAFSITGILAGAYTLTISRTGYLTKSVTGYVVNGNKGGLVFYLNRSAIR